MANETSTSVSPGLFAITFAEVWPFSRQDRGESATLPKGRSAVAAVPRIFAFT
jgi:hypothetical protein